jgi:hypothetical protein
MIPVSVVRFVVVLGHGVPCIIIMMMSNKINHPNASSRPPDSFFCDVVRFIHTTDILIPCFCFLSPSSYCSVRGSWFVVRGSRVVVVVLSGMDDGGGQ